MVDVIKRSGRRQRFSHVKLARAVERAAKEAKLSTAKRRELVKEVSTGISSSLGRRHSIPAIDLRRRALRRLESRSKATLKSWRRFDRRRH